jgi:glucokinase
VGPVSGVDCRAIGLDIGATKTLGVLVDEDGRVLEQVREATEPGPDGVVRTAERVVAHLSAATDGAPPTSVGLGIPGLVDVERGAVKHAVNLGVDGEWVPLRAELEARLGVPVAVENDVNVATLGAVALSGIRDLVYLSIGTGLAAGLVLDGTLRRGATGAAGEIGHVPIDPLGAVCQCGQRGCLETVASGRALAEAWHPAGSVGSDEPPAQALFAAASAGDPRAIEVRDRFAAGVADAVRTLCLTVDPATIVLGGGVAHLGAPLVAAVSDALRAQAASSPFLASLDLAARIRVVPEDYPVAAIGAALLGRS